MARQEHRCAREIYGIAPPSSGRPCRYRLFKPWDLPPPLRRQAGVDETGKDTVHLDVIFCPSDREAAAELENSPFARAVGRKKGYAKDRRHGANGDDLPA